MIKMTDNTRTGIIMIAVAVVLLTVALLVLAAKDRAQDEQLAAGRCEIEAVTRCGIQKCHFRAVVDCAGLEELLKKQPGTTP